MKLSDYEQRAAREAFVTVVIVGAILVIAFLLLVGPYIGFRNGMWQ